MADEKRDACPECGWKLPRDPCLQVEGPGEAVGLTFACPGCLRPIAVNVRGHIYEQVAPADEGPRKALLDDLCTSLPALTDSALERTLCTANDMLQATMRELAKRKGLGRLPG